MSLTIKKARFRSLKIKAKIQVNKNQGGKFRSLTLKVEIFSSLKIKAARFRSITIKAARFRFKKYR